MLVNKISQSPTFGGIYKLNVNQQMKNIDACLKRDHTVAMWTAKSSNKEVVQDKLIKFMLGDYHKNKKANCDIVLKINDAENKTFEESMKSVGQKFSKLA